MKKLIAILMALLSVGCAVAEEAVAVTATESLANLPLMTRGLIVTAGGLIGVFLVLILFFLLIKGMQKILK